MPRPGKKDDRMNRRTGENPLGAGGSSFELIDATILFDELGLKKGDTFLDLACGRGLYTLAAAEFVGEKGRLFALDLWEEGVASLILEAARRGFANISATVGDVRDGIPIESGAVDVCLMASVLHDFVAIGADSAALDETARMLKPGGLLAVVEFKKMDGPPGPPASVRLVPEQVEKLVLPFGFTGKSFRDLGSYHYLVTYLRSGLEKT